MTIFDIPWLSESIKKRALRYLLQRYLGNFLLEKLTLDQLSIDLYNGKGSIRDLILDVDGLNDELKFLPFKFINGSIDDLNVSVPWAALLTEECNVHLNGASFVCQLVTPVKTENVDSTIISKSLMTSSMQIAEEIVNEEEDKFDGLEIFAQLIDSVLRRVKLFAENTTLKIVAPKKSGDGEQIEVSIKYMRCEEEESIGDNKEETVNLSQELITKIITLEGVEISINDDLVCKLSGKHSFRIKIEENKSDIQIYLGSYILAILTSKQFQTLANFFDNGDQVSSSQAFGEKMMSSQDYARIEQQLQMDACYMNTNQPTISSSSVTLGANNWSACSPAENEPTFLPLNKVLGDDKSEKHNETKQSVYSCHIKIPGLMFCLLSDEENTFSQNFGLPIMESFNSFEVVNQYLDDALEGLNHLRFLAFRLFFDINSKLFSLSCGDLMVKEQTKNGLKSVLWSEHQTQIVNTPRFRLKMIDDNISIEFLTSTCLQVDPTFLERYHHYYKSESNENYSLDKQIIVKCETLKAELLIPIPDLRIEKDFDVPSKLREESLLFNFHEFRCKINQTNCELTSKSFKAGHKTGQNPYINVIHGQSIGNELICLKIQFSNSGIIKTTIDDADINLLMEADMEDSIYISHSSNSQNITEPFQVKRKVIGGGTNDNEQIITPGDRNHFEKFLDHVLSSSQMSFELTVPSGEINFQNKQQFELIYNRCGNDLAFWEPNSEIFFQSKSDKQNLPQPTFFTCKPIMTESYDSDSSFHSFEPFSQKTLNYLMTWIVKSHDLTFTIGTKESGQQSIFGQNVFLGFAIGNDEDRKNSVCFSTENLCFKSDDTTIISGNIYNDSDCRLNMAVDIQRNTDLKTIKLALQLSNPLLYEFNFNVFEKIWDFLNVIDEPVLGYIPPKIITELHFDIDQGAISLENQIKRPVLIMFDNIYITSMVVENTDQTLLRIIADEALLCFKKDKTSIEALKNYICIVQSGLIDLNLKLDRDEKIEFKVSNNEIHIRACPDSFSALCQLIESFSSPSSPSGTNYNTNITYSENGNSNFDNLNYPDGDLIEDAMGDVHQELDSNEDLLINSDDDQIDFKTDEGSPPLDESSFFILGDDDLGAGIKASSEPQIRILASEPIKVLENHFGISHHKIIPDITPATLARYLLEEMTLILHLFDGRDFDNEEEPDEIKNEKFDTKSTRHSLATNFTEPRVRFCDGSIQMWESLDLASAPGAFRPQTFGSTSGFKTCGGLKRQNDTCVQLCFSKVKILFENFDESVSLSWRFFFFVHDIEVIDRVSASKIKKMLYEYSSESMPKKPHRNMVSIKATTHHNQTDKHEECDLRISVKPLRINIDQDTLMFVGEFFSTVMATLSSTETANTANVQVNQEQNYIPEKPIEVPIIDFNDEYNEKSSESSPPNMMLHKPKSNKIYFKSFSFIPDVPIRLDYHGKRVDFEMVIDQFAL